MQTKKMETTRWLDEFLAARGLSRETLESRVASEEHRHKKSVRTGKPWPLTLEFPLRMWMTLRTRSTHDRLIGGLL